MDGRVGGGLQHDVSKPPQLHDQEHRFRLIAGTEMPQ
jgi:hypothetical protein